MARSNVTQRLKLAVATAAERQPQLARRSISPHTVRQITAMHLLQSGVDITVIALWLGHESPATTQVYLQADLSMKERTLDRLQSIRAHPGRYRPPNQLMQFLLNLSIIRSSLRWKSLACRLSRVPDVSELRIITRWA